MEVDRVKSIGPELVVEPITGSLFAKMLVPAAYCQCCKEKMIYLGSINSNTFMLSGPHTVENQIQLLGLHVAYRNCDENTGQVCTTCVASGKIKVECDLCKEERLLSSIKVRYPEIQKYLCTPCFETVSAKRWEEAKEKLSRLESVS